MRAKELLKKYPEQWATMEASVWDDMKYQFKKMKTEQDARFVKSMRVIAYNAAFNAVCLIHAERKRQKPACLKSCNKAKKEEKHDA